MSIARVHPKINFAKLIRSTEQQPREIERADSRKDSIRARLRRSFDIAGITTIGSFSRGTAVRNRSDVDLLVNLRRNEAKWAGDLVSSSRILQRVRNDLNDRFVSTTVRRDGQAATVSFAKGRQKVDVVPAIFSRFEKGNPVYGIPDGSGKWLETSPRAHLVWLRKAQLRSGGKLNKVVRLLKLWKLSRMQTDALSSFYLELWLAHSSICIGAKTYTEILLETFNALYHHKLKRISDPVGVSGWIYAAKTATQMQAVNEVIRGCSYHATAAINAELKKNYEEANRQWNVVFNGRY